jgi:hypothetical protein
MAGSVGGTALGRRQVVSDIFTDASSSCGGRKAKSCVCGKLLDGEGAGFELVWQLQKRNLSGSTVCGERAQGLVEI